ncbi:MAG: penicillin acylase family protein, partial [Methanothrix sp.]|nr:penicillin acylase family protein [Methanothrix sp.]
MEQHHSEGEIMHQMRHNPRTSSRSICLMAACLLVTLVFATSCTRMLQSRYEKSVAPLEGKISMRGITEPVTVRRDNLGIPFNEARNMKDLAFAIGYVHASDRLTQMIGLKLISEGRLAEMAGEPALDIDVFMRTMNLKKAAQLLYAELSPEKKEPLSCYTLGVNAYLREYEDRLPPELAMSGYKPDAWEVRDSICIMALVNFALSFNMHEEVSSLVLVQALGPEKAAWLMPVSPDEPIPFQEAGKLAGIDLRGRLQQAARITSATGKLASLGLTGIAASNNWVIAKERTANKASILANDTHLFLTNPCM